MNKPNWQDIWGGVLIIAFGAFFAWYAQHTMNLGSLRRMGAGAFPLGVGIILMILGVLIVLPALRKPGPKIEFAIRTPLIILAAVCAFAFCVPRLGVVPAIFATVFISSLADRRLTPLFSFLVSISLSAAIWLLFVQGLNLPIPMFDWSW
ncbi:tripartite tricarboxylate transporter TctB family protein [Roseibacterium sp. SDUM158016]|uniref:tripartite tricarboxylate transporter TctB family protein n=1 Tax=Roseicyclus sediminis TaxID=2980997 RepID=UPI0021D10A87|nr:tripartite tricarboxylate transporter TctB family protein [Roseibacterium sp. SDUM158016]MCU4652037.1 tripartite tricarboxylate transporter TctB family protein [Roseibacterium sp. SDUM158016]